MRIVILAASFCAYGADLRDEFESRVRPVLARNCYACHTQTRMGGLRVDSREDLLKGGHSGPAVVPGRAGDSLLVKVVAHRHDRIKMPPTGKLSPGEIEALERWIENGAFWPSGDKPQAATAGEFVITPEHRAFWAFQPVKQPDVPAVRDRAWPRSPIDHFILARLEREGLRPGRPASRADLLRRVTLNLTGLPPSPEDYDAFLGDKSPGALAKVVDRLLASPQYGERWARHWLDVARYSDDHLNSTADQPYENAFRYRNWVIDAFNQDMPYDVFVKAQLAGDLLRPEDPARYGAGLGFLALSPEMQDERVDALTRGFLGLTVACAQCHDHKFDPIPTKDFYSLQGVLNSTEPYHIPLVPPEEVSAWHRRQETVEAQKKRVQRFQESLTRQVGEMLAARTAQYLLATRGKASTEGLDAETLERWRRYLQKDDIEHPFLKDWLDRGDETAAREFQQRVRDVIEEKASVDEQNLIRLGQNPSRDDLANASLVSLERNRYVLYRDLFDGSTRDSAGFFARDPGVYHYAGAQLDRFLSAHQRQYLADLKAELELQEKALGPMYPFLHALRDKEKPVDMRVHIRGDRNNLGEVAPRRFLAILSPQKRNLFSVGSGRMELAEAIASGENPLTARVIVNRVWHHHFGRGIVGTPSNFGQLGERPTHPELLDWLAADFVKNGWSLKRLHRQIVLSAVYGLSSEAVEPNASKDPDNRLLWRANRRRLDVEALRDSMLMVAGRLDLAPGELAKPLDENNRKRTVYGFVSRRKVDSTLALFDFPNPNSSAEQRVTTNVPLQRLFFMNSFFVEQQAAALAARWKGTPEDQVKQAWRMVLGRAPAPMELKRAAAFVADGRATGLARVLLSSNEFVFLP